MDTNEYAITTFDNPYDPFNQFSQWFTFDVTHGYNTCAYLDRVTYVSDSMTDGEADKEIERGIDEIIKYDFLSIYKKVRKGEFFFDLTDKDNIMKPLENGGTRDGIGK